jgi:hypothetical protein
VVVDGHMWLINISYTFLVLCLTSLVSHCEVNPQILSLISAVLQSGRDGLFLCSGRCDDRLGVLVCSYSAPLHPPIHWS